MPNHDYRPDLMGRAQLFPATPVVAGAWTSFKLVYTAGKFGIDDQGGLKLAFRTHSDMTPLQTADPAAPGYLTVETSNGAPVEVDYSFRRNLRPWGKCVTVVCKRFLGPGDRIVLRIGDRRGGSPGVRMQTHVESAHQFRVTVDPFATADYIPLPEAEQACVAVIAGEPVSWKAILPTLRRPGRPFRLVVKAEDRWGNPAGGFRGELDLRASLPVAGLPGTIAFTGDEFAVVVDDLRVAEAGDVHVEVLRGQALLARSNPLRIDAATPFEHFWSDMHGQSGETIGSGTAREYFHFARYAAFLDIAGHQGNDFQMSDAFWAEINRLTAEFNEEGAFLALPGYEWSGNTGLGGDHNVWYRREGRPIYRSSRALIADTTDPETDCHDVRELFAALRDEDVLVVPHVGGRFADVAYAHDAMLEPSVEIHSSWGTFDWILQDALKMGYRVGIVAGSDGHKGRPGASYPGDAKFGAYGGLTCHLLPELTRDSLFEHFRRRHHYATTGARLYLSARMRFAEPVRIHHRDPQQADGDVSRQCHAMMGDIVETTGEEAQFDIDISAHCPVLKIEIFDGLRLVETHRPYGAGELGDRFRIGCRGQETRGRGRMVTWDVSARLSGGRIARLEARNFYNPDRQPETPSADRLRWKGVTTGGMQAVDLWVERTGREPLLELKTNHADARIALDDLGMEPLVVPCGGLDKALVVERLPDTLSRTGLSLSRPVSIARQGDTAIFVRVSLEDGHLAWSSPVYVYRSPRK